MYQRERHETYPQDAIERNCFVQLWNIFHKICVILSTFYWIQFSRKAKHEMRKSLLRRGEGGVQWFITKNVTNLKCAVKKVQKSTILEMEGKKKVFKCFVRWLHLPCRKVLIWDLCVCDVRWLASHIYNLESINHKCDGRLKGSLRKEIGQKFSQTFRHVMTSIVQVSISKRFISLVISLML